MCTNGSLSLTPWLWLFDDENEVWESLIADWYMKLVVKYLLGILYYVPYICNICNIILGKWKSQMCMSMRKTFSNELKPPTY